MRRREEQLDEALGDLVGTIRAVRSSLAFAAPEMQELHLRRLDEAVEVADEVLLAVTDPASSFGTVSVHVVGLEPFKDFLERVDALAEKAPEMTGYEVQSELRRLIEALTEPWNADA